ncbi:unnamed protein product [Lepeophtheirus salmonis]|uniref:(salmon louse) hypothetical protein n=1 Tax=Lepeophtheirus salmonis TaxID=72036 RepID=A0A817F9X2_LEPSM|nr:unnamed protein product [Lepeophtheirus salmonis]CAG9476379.1 unnamed protein product [Lepeophtheirus salmonis]
MPPPPVVWSEPQQQQSSTSADHAGMLRSLDREINIQLNRPPVERGNPFNFRPLLNLPTPPTASSRTWNAEEQATLSNANRANEAMLILQAAVNTPLTYTQIISDFEGASNLLNFLYAPRYPTTLSPNEKRLLKKEYTGRPPTSLISKLSDLMIQQFNIESQKPHTTVPTRRRVTSSSATRAVLTKCLNWDFLKAARSLLQGEMNSLARRWPLIMPHHGKLTLRTSFNEVRGVKFESGILQRNPISGLRFNLVIDLVLADMNTHESFHINGSELSCLVFANDIVLISSTSRGLKASVDAEWGDFGSLNSFCDLYWQGTHAQALNQSNDPIIRTILQLNPSQYTLLPVTVKVYQLQLHFKLDKLPLRYTNQNRELPNPPQSTEVLSSLSFSVMPLIKNIELLPLLEWTQITGKDD